MQPDCDLIILGGGCAGLSLGLRLAESAGSLQKIIILEQRSHYENDRTWCFWRMEAHRFEHLIEQSWSTMAVRSFKSATLLDCSKTPYQVLPADRFYTYTVDKIKASAIVDLRMNMDVLDTPIKRGEHWHVATNDGVLTSLYVVDTRSRRQPLSNDAVLWQSFLGHEIISETEIFDPETVELMDFQSGFGGNVHFSYTLPFSKTRALVETTVFGPDRLDAGALAGVQAANISRLLGGAKFKIHRTENGILPMGVTRSASLAECGYVQVGLFHGGARPGTGYAFQRIQRWADDCAAEIRQGRMPCGHRSDPLATRLMDSLFLKVLRSSPERGAEIFTTLFKRVDPSRIIRFLSDLATPVDRASVVAALPPSLFLKQLLTNVFTLFASGVRR